MADAAPRRPQDRVRAILESRLSPPMRLVLVALADRMTGDQLVCWPSVEDVAARTGYCERQAREILNAMEARGFIHRVVGEHRSRDVTIDWSALASAVDEPEARGGRRTPAKAAASLASADDEAPGKDCHHYRQSLPQSPAKIATHAQSAETEQMLLMNANYGGKNDRQRLPPKHEATNEATNEATTLSATADVAPDPPEKRKATRKAKDTPEPHPFNQRVIDAWTRVWGKCRVGEPPYVWAKRDVMILVKCVRDPYVSRDPVKGIEDMQRVGAAMTRYLSQEVDGRFVKGLSIQNFAGDVAKWFTSVDAATKIQRGREPAPSIQDLVSAARQLGAGAEPSPTLSPSGRVVIDVTGVSS